MTLYTLIPVEQKDQQPEKKKRNGIITDGEGADH